MRFKIVLSILLLSFVGTTLKAQSKFYVGVEANFIQDEYLVNDEGNTLAAPLTPKVSIPGTTLLFGYQFHPNFSIETGFAIRPVSTGYSIMEEGRFKSSSRSSGSYYHLPLKFRSKAPLWADKLFFTTAVGVQFSATDPTRIGMNTTPGYSEGSTTMNGQLLYSERATYLRKEKFFTTIMAEIGLEYNLNDRFSIYSTFSYNRGFSELSRVNVEYQFQNEPLKKGSVLNQGSYISTNFGLKYRF